MRLRVQCATPQGMFEKKVLAKRALAPLAVAYVGYIVLNNLNLQINTVGFYQISKIAVAPAGVEPASNHCLIMPSKRSGDILETRH